MSDAVFRCECGAASRSDENALEYTKFVEFGGGLERGGGLVRVCLNCGRRWSNYYVLDATSVDALAQAGFSVAPPLTGEARAWLARNVA